MEIRRSGQHARETTRRLARRALALLALALIAGLAAGAIVGFRSWAFFGVEILIILSILAIDRWLAPAVERRSRGAAGEEHVGRVIEELTGDGWFALHDVSLGRGNIDHVLIGPAGLLTVETKSHGGRLDVQRLDVRMLKQAQAQAKLLSLVSWREVAPLLVFSRAYLYPKPVSRQRGVVVLPARMLKRHLARRKPTMTRDEAAQLHARLAAALADT